MSKVDSLFDVIIIGAGAAGLMCAIESAKRGRKVLILEKSNKPGKKILMSGGGRCNFTNYNVDSSNFISQNPHFCKSALSRYTQWDFIDKVKKHKIPFHEKKHGKLFCDNKSKDILNLLLQECEQYKVTIELNCLVTDIVPCDSGGFTLIANHEKLSCQSLVIASGGLTIPTMGSSPFAYEIAKQFSINVYPTTAALVPLTLHKEDKERYSDLSGISANILIENERISFHEDLLFTHRGLSGPAVLQISSYWRPGESLSINLLPSIDLFQELTLAQKTHAKIKLKTFLNKFLAKRLVETWLSDSLGQCYLADINHQTFREVTDFFQAWILKPNGTEGYRTAEVTLGGIDCNALSSKTMEVKQMPGLYFIGEALDVTGWLGGYNFQWAWSSGVAAGQVC